MAIQNKFQNVFNRITGKAPEVETPVVKSIVPAKITRKEADVSFMINPNTAAASDAYVKSLTGYDLSQKRLQQVNDQVTKTDELISNYKDMIEQTKDESTKNKIQIQLDDLNRKKAYYNQYVTDYKNPSALATIPASITGGIVSLIGGGAATKAIGTKVTTFLLDTFKNNIKLATILGKGAHGAATFGLVDTVKEGVSQLQNKDLDLAKLAKTGGTGALTGALMLGPSGHFGKGITGALKEAGYQGTIASAMSLLNMDEKDKEHVGQNLAVNFIVGSLFGLLANKGVTEQVRRDALQQSKNAMAEVFMKNTDMPAESAVKFADEMMNTVVTKYSGEADVLKGLNKLDENSFYRLTSMLKQGKKIHEGVPKFISTTGTPAEKAVVADAGVNKNITDASIVARDTIRPPLPGQAFGDGVPGNQLMHRTYDVDLKGSMPASSKVTKISELVNRMSTPNDSIVIIPSWSFATTPAQRLISGPMSKETMLKNIVDAKAMVKSPTVNDVNIDHGKRMEAVAYKVVPDGNMFSLRPIVFMSHEGGDKNVLYNELRSDYNEFQDFVEKVGEVYGPKELPATVLEGGGPRLSDIDLQMFAKDMSKPVVIPPEDKDAAIMLKRFGMEYVGQQRFPGEEPFILFNHPKSHSTLMMSRSEINPTSLRLKIKEHESKVREIATPTKAQETLKKEIMASKRPESAYARSLLRPTEDVTIEKAKGWTDNPTDIANIESAAKYQQEQGVDPNVFLAKSAIDIKNGIALGKKLAKKVAGLKVVKNKSTMEQADVLGEMFVLKSKTEFPVRDAVRFDANAPALESARKLYPTSVLVIMDTFNKRGLDAAKEAITKGTLPENLTRAGMTIDIPGAPTAPTGTQKIIFIATEKGNKVTLEPVLMSTDMGTSAITTTATRIPVAKTDIPGVLRQGDTFKAGSQLFKTSAKSVIKDFEDYVQKNVVAASKFYDPTSLPSNVSKVTRDMPDSQFNTVIFKAGLDENGELRAQPFIKIVAPVLRNPKYDEIKAELDVALTSTDPAKVDNATAEVDKTMGSGYTEKLRSDMGNFLTGLFADYEKEGLISKDMFDNTKALIDGGFPIGTIDQVVGIAKTMLDNKAQFIMNNKLVDFFTRHRGSLPSGVDSEGIPHPDLTRENVVPFKEFTTLEDFVNQYSALAGTDKIRIIETKDNGDKYLVTYSVKDKDLYEAITNAPDWYDTLPKAYKLLKKFPATINKIGRSFMISLSWAFPVKDAIRNLIGSLAYSKVSSGDQLKNMAKMASQSATSIEKLVEISKTRELTEAEAQALQYFWMGGDESSLSSEAAQLVIDMKKKLEGDVNLPTKVIDTLNRFVIQSGENLSKMADHPMRMGEVKAMTDEGRDIYDALASAKEIGLDFKDKTPLTKVINDWVLFYGSAIKGLEKMIEPMIRLGKKAKEIGFENLTDDEKKTVHKYWIMIGSLAALRAGVEIFNRRDEETERRYDNVDPRIKQNALVIMGKPGTYYTLSMPQELMVLPSLGAKILNEPGNIPGMVSTVLTSLQDVVPGIDQSYFTKWAAESKKTIDLFAEEEGKDNVKIEDLEPIFMKIASTIAPNDSRAEVWAQQIQKWVKTLVPSRGLSHGKTIGLMVDLISGKNNVVSQIGQQFMEQSVPSVFVKREKANLKGEYYMGADNLASSILGEIRSYKRQAMLMGPDGRALLKSKGLDSDQISDILDKVSELSGMYKNSVKAANLKKVEDLAKNLKQVYFKAFVDLKAQYKSGTPDQDAINRIMETVNEATDKFVSDPVVAQRAKTGRYE